MKKLPIIIELLGLALLLASSSGCKKEDNSIVAPVIGRQYMVKTDYYIFSKGAFRPQDPVTLVNTYKDYKGIDYTTCSGRIDWNSLATKAGDGVKQSTVDGNAKSIAGYAEQGIRWGDTTTIQWPVPLYDLKEL